MYQQLNKFNEIWFARWDYKTSTLAIHAFLHWKTLICLCITWKILLMRQQCYYSFDVVLILVMGVNCCFRQSSRWKEANVKGSVKATRRQNPVITIINSTITQQYYANIFTQLSLEDLSSTSITSQWNRQGGQWTNLVQSLTKVAKHMQYYSNYSWIHSKPEGNSLI